MAFEFTDTNFETEVLRAEGLVVVDFWAPWCGPCQMMSPVIDALASKYDGKVKIGKLNVEENGLTAQQYGIMSIPAIKFFKNGEVVKDLVGARSEEALAADIEEALAS